MKSELERQTGKSGPHRKDVLLEALNYLISACLAGENQGLNNLSIINTTDGNQTNIDFGEKHTPLQSVSILILIVMFSDIIILHLPLQIQ